MSLKMVSSLFLIIFLVTSGRSSNILCIYPSASISHQVAFRALTKDLLARGHNLTVITTDPMKTNNSNLTEIDFSFFYEDVHKMFNFAKTKSSEMNQYFFYDLFLSIYENIYDAHLSRPEIQKLIQNTDNLKFDLVIVEFMMCVPWFAFSRKFNAPLIGINSADALSLTHEDIGNVFNPAIHPDFMIGGLHPPLNINERWQSLKFYFWNKFYYLPQFDAISTKIMERYFEGIKTTPDELRKSLQLLLVNVNPVMGFVRPIVPTTIQLGFMHIQEPKPLPNNLQEFLDRSENGVIYMSLGSNVRSSDLNEQVLNIFKNVFKYLNYNILWKFEDENLSNKPENVMIAQWLPQQDVLAHPNVKLFITQGGQKSTEEAIDRTVPMVVIPFLFDQEGVAKKVQRMNIGVSINFFKLTENSLRDAIGEVLKPKYKKNIENLRELIYDQPMTSREKAVWWVEYVIRHNGTKHLDYIGRYIPFYQKYCLDFIITGLLIFILMKFIVKSCFKFIKKAKLEKTIKIKNKRE